jgi:hypothetical protein
MSLISVAFIFLGFAPSFYLKDILHGPPPLSFLSAVHGIVFSLWVLLFVTQVALVRVNHIALHRQLGILGAIMFGAVFVVGVSTAITAARLGHAAPGSPAPPLSMTVLPLISLAGSLLLVALGLWNRRRSDWHKRLMMASLFTFTPPGTGRLLVNFGYAQINIQAALGMVALLILCLIAYDFKVYKRLHPANALALTIVVIVQAATTWAFFSPTWLAFAQWLTQS